MKRPSVKKTSVLLSGGAHDVCIQYRQLYRARVNMTCRA